MSKNPNWWEPYDLSGAKLDAPEIIYELPEQHRETFLRLVHEWSRRLPRNMIKNKYYDYKNTLKDLGISIPPQLRNVETVVGWPSKAVDSLAVRSRFDGYVFNDYQSAELEDILEANDIKNMYSEAVVAELKNSCAFLTISHGQADEPKVLVSSFSASTASAIWDGRKKRIKAGLTIVETDPDSGEPTWLNMYTDDAVFQIRKSLTGGWSVHIDEHDHGVPLMVPMVYRPSIDRPFGKSRISRAVMSITDSAVRAALRAEVSAEFFTTPQRYLLGADEDTFENQADKWRAYIGAMFVATRDENDDAPSYGQLPQMTMQPHIDYMRSLAARFAGETNVPVSELGIIHDNPSSAEAIYAAKESLVLEAEALNDRNGRAMRMVGMLAMAVAQEKTISDLTTEERSLSPIFRNPATPSIVSMADAMSKIAAMAPWITNSEVFLEMLGIPEDQRIRLMSDKKRADGRRVINDILKAGDTGDGYQPGVGAVLQRNGAGDTEAGTGQDITGS